MTFLFSQPLSGSLKCDVKGAEFYPHTNCEYTFDENRHNTSFVNFKGSKVKNHRADIALVFIPKGRNSQYLFLVFDELFGNKTNE